MWKDLAAATWQTWKPASCLTLPLYSGDHEGEMSQTLEVEIESSANNDLVNPVTGLLGNYPNPFNLSYNHKILSERSLRRQNRHLIQKIKMVRKLVEAHMDRINHTAVWNGQDNNGNTVGEYGLYLYKMQKPRLPKHQENDLNEITISELIDTAKSVNS